MIKSQTNICRCKFFYPFLKRIDVAKVVTLHPNVWHYIISLSTFLELATNQCGLESNWHALMQAFFFVCNKEMKKFVIMHANYCTYIDLRQSLNNMHSWYSSQTHSDWTIRGLHTSFLFPKDGTYKLRACKTHFNSTNAICPN